MRLSVVVHVIGILVALFGPMFLAPAAVAIYYGEHADALGFALTAGATILLGAVMRRAGGAQAVEATEQLRRIEGLSVVAGSWMLMAHLAAVPYMWAGVGFIDALFESMSGLTTTGATIFTDFGRFGRGIFFWRSMTQWLGGMGVIALFVAVLPRLAIGGREVFFAEAPGPTDQKLTPQLRQTALALWRLYAALTAAEALALWAVGMSPFDAVCHSMTTLAAGGFSPHPESIAGYRNPAAEWIICVFMFLAGANFALQVRVVRGRLLAFTRDEEFRAYALTVVVSTMLLTFVLASSGIVAADSIRLALFQALSILTTTGYASTDFQLWSPQAKVVLLALMFIGGSAGSAAGGPKVVRHVLLARYTLRELKRTLHPRAMLPVKLGGRVVADDVMRNVIVFMLFYVLTFAVGSAIVIGLGADLVTGMTAMAATLGNVGPGFDGVGPMAHFAHLHPVSRVVLTLAMWIGRLEVLTVLVLFRWEIWRTARWRPD
jgi:trk system potassium uptake protein TrkH